jgi:hypothetical protein
MFSASLYDPDRLRCVEIARSASDNVVISGICPRLDDKDGHISAGNRILSKIAHDENLYFVDNDIIKIITNTVVTANLNDNVFKISVLWKM